MCPPGRASLKEGSRASVAAPKQQLLLVNPQSDSPLNLGSIDFGLPLIPFLFILLASNYLTHEAEMHPLVFDGSLIA